MWPTNVDVDAAVDNEEVDADGPINDLDDGAEAEDVDAENEEDDELMASFLRLYEKFPYDELLSTLDEVLPYLPYEEEEKLDELR